MKQEFDDGLLIKLATQNYLASTKKDSDLENILKKNTPLSNSDRNYLLTAANKYSIEKPKSILQMKSEIFRKIGHTSGNHYGTVNREELMAVYRHIMGIVSK